MAKENDEDTFLIKNNRAIFGKPNKIGITPLEMAAYLGKPRVFPKNPPGFQIRCNPRCLFQNANGCSFPLKIFPNQSGIPHLHFEKDIVDCIEFGTKEDFLEIFKLLSTKKIKKYSSFDIRHIFFLGPKFNCFL
jgi:hypothetical protein